MFIRLFFSPSGSKKSSNVFCIHIHPFVVVCSDVLYYLRWCENFCYFFRKTINTHEYKYYHDRIYHHLGIEAKHYEKHRKSRTHTSFFFKGSKAIKMAALTLAVIGFLAGLFTMTMISLYKYVIKIVSH